MEECFYVCYLVVAYSSQVKRYIRWSKFQIWFHNSCYTACLDWGIAPRYGSSLIISCCNIAEVAAFILKTQTMAAAKSEREKERKKKRNRPGVLSVCRQLLSNHFTFFLFFFLRGLLPHKAARLRQRRSPL